MYERHISHKLRWGIKGTQWFRKVFRLHGNYSKTRNRGKHDLHCQVVINRKIIERQRIACFPSRLLDHLQDFWLNKNTVQGILRCVNNEKFSCILNSISWVEVRTIRSELWLFHCLVPVWLFPRPSFPVPISFVFNNC